MSELATLLTPMGPAHRKRQAPLRSHLFFRVCGLHYWGEEWQGTNKNCGLHSTKSTVSVVFKQAKQKMENFHSAVTLLSLIFIYLFITDRISTFLAAQTTTDNTFLTSLRFLECSWYACR